MENMNSTLNFVDKSISSDREKQKQVEEQNEKYRLIAENTTDLISLIEVDGSFQYTSPSFEAILNYDISTIRHLNFFDMIHPDDQAMVNKEIRIFCKRKKTVRHIEIRIRDNKGDYTDIEASFSVIDKSSFSKNDLILVVMRDIRFRKIFEQKIYHLAFHDTLTNLPNRRSFMNELNREILDRKKMKTPSKMSVLFIDLDNFKSINDQWGHDVGDQVLIEAARIIKNAIRPSDLVGRVGGDEFIALLKDIKDEEDLKKYVNQIITKFNSPISISGQEYILTCSIGIATYPNDGISSRELIKNADDALYNVKNTGKNHYLIFNNKIKNESLERRLLENALRNAIKEEQFYLEYQPKLNISTKQLIGMEALVRWRHPELGTIPPGKFISLAEETGLIVPLGEWILRESCKQMKKWQEIGNQSLVISVNVSIRQLEDPNFIKTVEKILKETDLDPKWLEIEVTESVFMDVNDAASVLEEIRQLGIQISIDDFGTGYSSLSYLKHLPIDTLKVDASFIKDIHENEESKAIVKSVLTLAATLGLNVIAEGIETQEHVNELNKDGLLFGQGFYFSKPLNSQAFEEYLLKEVNA
ncbi:EAL domain-containing protein [Fredinandcohnia sp. QZ13]|uniref:putative bifunctional diguanylate cyclase/phosphodiesterase n=1 Tax=Fredinandcohnia sp. QZ13 TaxID=3073144 RepID=UPI00285366B6|nr:EAL domain-containing protein [Fredinandcohnia sp. QZ13]MDR4887840.1 EAL domain-containing protein [Fredinandcohnia sp. QZ13]